MPACIKQLVVPNPLVEIEPQSPIIIHTRASQSTAAVDFVDQASQSTAAAKAPEASTAAAATAPDASTAAVDEVIDPASQSTAAAIAPEASTAAVDEVVDGPSQSTAAATAPAEAATAPEASTAAVDEVVDGASQSAAATAPDPMDLERHFENLRQHAIRQAQEIEAERRRRQSQVDEVVNSAASAAEVVQEEVGNTNNTEGWSRFDADSGEAWQDDTWRRNQDDEAWHDDTWRRNQDDQSDDRWRSSDDWRSSDWQSDDRWHSNNWQSGDVSHSSSWDQQWQWNPGQLGLGRVELGPAVAVDLGSLGASLGFGLRGLPLKDTRRRRRTGSPPTTRSRITSGIASRPASR